MPHRMTFALALIAILPGCGTSGSSDAVDAGPLVLSENWDYDMTSTALAVDLAAQRTVATIEFQSQGARSLSFEVGDLQITSIRSGERALHHQRDGSRLDVEIPVPDGTSTIVFESVYSLQTNNDGVLSAGMTLLWPYHCGNLFPCKSAPDDGLKFELDITGAPDGKQVIYPAAIPTDAPSYMPAWAVGAYTHKDLGTTTAGTRVSVWFLPGGEATADQGTARLRDIMQFYETTYGPYPFGDHVGAIAVDWGASNGYAAIEHHPYWHVSVDSMSSEVTQAHEAAHGWFGNGVRIRCWEDFVLSEGTVSYMAARAVEEVGGAEAGATAWAGFKRRLDRLEASTDTKIAWPTGCMTHDILDDGIFGTAAYMRGAYFFKALEGRVGRAALDSAIASFYQANVNGASGMQDLLDVIKNETSYDPTACAQAWLQSEPLPTDATCP